MTTTKPPVLTDELDPRLIGWLRARQDWPHVLLDQTAVRQVIAVLARAGADAVRDAALEEAAETCEQYQGSAETCADAIRALKGTPAAAVADDEEIIADIIANHAFHDIEHGKAAMDKWQMRDAAKDIVAHFAPQAAQLSGNAGYAGVTVWIGNVQVTRVVSQIAIEAATGDPLKYHFESARTAIAASKGAKP